MKKIFYSILLLTIFFPRIVGATWFYDRLPAGTEITSPVSFEISATLQDFQDDCNANCSVENNCVWYVRIIKWTETEEWHYDTEKISIENLNHTFELDLPLDFYNLSCVRVEYTGGSDYCDIPPEDCCFEEDFENPIFTITGIEEEPMIPITSDFVLGAIAYADVVWNDFSLLALFGIGLPLGFWVVKKVVGMF